MQIKTFHRGRSHFREVLVGGRVAGYLTVIDYRVRLPSAAAKMGAVAEVHTFEEFRMKGCMRALMEDTVRYMAGRGYVVSILFGIADFYHRFGYVCCLPRHEVSFLTAVAERAGRDRRGYRPRRFRNADAEKVLAIYNHNNRRRTCSVMRKAEYFAGYSPKRQEFVVLTDPRGRVAAYAISDRTRRAAIVLEVGALTADAFPALLGEAAKLGIRRRLEVVRFHLPPDHPFADFCRRFDCRQTTHYHRNRGGMMRIINQGGLFEKLRGDWARRIQASAFGSHVGTLRFKTDLDDTSVIFRRGAVEVAGGPKKGTLIALPQGGIAQMLTGYRSPRSVLHAAGVRAGPKTLGLLDVLFAGPRAYVWDQGRYEELHLLPRDVEAQPSPTENTGRT